MKRTVLAGMAVVILSAASGMAHAFTAIAWSESGQKGGSVKDAPTKEAAISSALADCKKNGGGADCQVFKVTDEPGFVSLFATCAKTCGVTAVAGRPTAEQARADGKRDCENHFKNPCQLAQEWEERGASISNATIPRPANDGKINNNNDDPSKDTRKSTNTLEGKIYKLVVNVPPYAKGPFKALNVPGISMFENDEFLEGSIRFYSRLPTSRSGVNYTIHYWETKNNTTSGKFGSSADELAKKALARIGLADAEKAEVKFPTPNIPGASAVGYLSNGVAYNNPYHGQRVAYVYAVMLPNKKAGYAISSSVLEPLNDIQFERILGKKPSTGLEKIPDVLKAGFWHMAANYTKGESYWKQAFKENPYYKRSGALVSVAESYPDIKKNISQKDFDAYKGAIARIYGAYGGIGPKEDGAAYFFEAEDYVQLVDMQQNARGSKEAESFLLDGTSSERSEEFQVMNAKALKAMNWLFKNIEFATAAK